MNVHLGETLERFITDLVKAGNYQTQSEVVREGLRLLQDREVLRSMQLAELRKDIRQGMEDLDAGRSVPAKAVFSELRGMSAARRKAGKR